MALKVFMVVNLPLADYLEVISFVGAAVVTRGSIRIKNAGIDHLSMIRLVLKRLGVDIEYDGPDLIVELESKISY